jgi:hypothetical protein
MELTNAKCKLKREYFKLLRMKNEADCGSHLHEYISPRFSEQKRKVTELYDLCQKLEGRP